MCDSAIQFSEFADLIDSFIDNDEHTDEYAYAEAAWKAAIEQMWLEDPQLWEHNAPKFNDFLNHLTELRIGKQPTTPLGFVINPGAANAAAAGAASIGKVFGGDINNAMSEAAKIYNRGRGIMNDVRKVEQNIRQAMNSNINPLSQGGNIGVDDGDGGITSDNYFGGSGFNPYGLSLATPPVDVKFETGIGVTNFPRFYKDGRDETGPLIIKSSVFNLWHSNSTDYADPYIQDYIAGPIIKDLLINVQSRERFNVNIQNLVQTEKFKEWCNRLSWSLSVYYFWQNVISYKNVSTNRNKGMDALYSSLDPSDFIKINTLGKNLEKVMIPPTLNEFIHAIYAPYKQSHMPGSPLIMYMPWFFDRAPTLPFTQLEGNGEVNTMVNLAINRIDNTFIEEWNGLFSRTNDTWSSPLIRGYEGAPLVDPGRSTLFANSAYTGCTVVNGAGTRHFVPYATSDTASISYNFHTDAPDGYLEALQMVDDISNPAAGKYGPGLFGPAWYAYDSSDPPGQPQLSDLQSTYGFNGVNGLSTSCYVYLDNNSSGATSPGFYPIEWSNRVQTLSGNTFRFILAGNAIPRYFQTYGATPAVNTVKMGMRYSTQQFLEWLFFKDFANGGTRGQKSLVKSNDKRFSRRSKGSKRNMKGSAGAKTAEKDEV